MNSKDSYGSKHFEELQKTRDKIEFNNKQIEMKDKELSEIKVKLRLLEKERTKKQQQYSDLLQILGDNSSIVNNDLDKKLILDSVPLTIDDGIATIKHKIISLNEVINKSINNNNNANNNNEINVISHGNHGNNNDCNDNNSYLTNSGNKELIIKINYQGNTLNYIVPDYDTYLFKHLVYDLKDFFNYNYNNIIIKDDMNLIWAGNYPVNQVIRKLDNENTIIYLVKDMQIFSNEEDNVEIIEEDGFVNAQKNIDKILEDYARENGLTDELVNAELGMGDDIKSNDSDDDKENYKNDYYKSINDIKPNKDVVNKNNNNDSINNEYDVDNSNTGINKNTINRSSISQHDKTIIEKKRAKKIKKNKHPSNSHQLDQQEQEVMFEIEKTFGATIVKLILYIIMMISLINYYNSKTVFDDITELGKSLMYRFYRQEYYMEINLDNGLEFNPQASNDEEEKEYKAFVSPMSLKDAYNYDLVWDWVQNILFDEIGFYSGSFQLNERYNLFGPLRITQLRAKYEEDCDPLSSRNDKKVIYCFGNTISGSGESGDFTNLIKIWNILTGGSGDTSDNDTNNSDISSTSTTNTNTNTSTTNRRSLRKDNIKFNSYNNKSKNKLNLNTYYKNKYSKNKTTNDNRNNRNSNIIKEKNSNPRNYSNNRINNNKPQYNNQNHKRTLSDTKTESFVLNFLNTCDFSVQDIESYSTGDYKTNTTQTELLSKLRYNEQDIDILLNLAKDERTEMQQYCFLLSGFFRRKLDYSFMIDGRISTYSPSTAFYIDFKTQNMKYNYTNINKYFSFLKNFWTSLNTRVVVISFNSIQTVNKKLSIVNYTFYIEQGLENNIIVSYQVNVFALFLNLIPFLNNDNILSKLKESQSSDSSETYKHYQDISKQTSFSFFDNNIKEFEYFIFLFLFSIINLIISLNKLRKENNLLNFKGMYSFYFNLVTYLLMFISFILRLIFVIYQYSVISNINDVFFNDFLPISYLVRNFEFAMEIIEVVVIILLVFGLFQMFYFEFFGRIFNIFFESLSNMASYLWVYLLIIISFSTAFVLLYGTFLKDFSGTYVSFVNIILFSYNKQGVIVELLAKNPFFSKIILLVFFIIVKLVLERFYFMLIYESYKKIHKENKYPLLKYSIIWYGIKYFAQNVYHKTVKYVKKIFKGIKIKY